MDTKLGAPTRHTTEGAVYDLSGGDWAALADAPGAGHDRIWVNLGPTHPSSHGVLRLALELDGETVTRCRPAVGFLHTGIEKTTEFRTWTQGVTLVTRADYLSPLFSEAAYSLAVERLLGVEAPARAQLIRILLMEVNRISSHLVTLGATGLELGAITVMTNGIRARERCLDVLEAVTGLRMNHAFVRPGGVAMDLPDGFDGLIRGWITAMWRELGELDTLVGGQPIWVNRLKDVGWLGVEGCTALGVTGPMLRGAGLAWDLRKTEPYLGYDTFDFDVPTDTRGDCWARFVVRVAEMAESLRIIEQVVERLEPGPVRVDDPRISWPARLELGPDGLGNSPAHVERIMTGSMEALIRHFKLVTEGFRVPAGQVYQPIESPRGELGAHVVSDGGTRPHRVHLREPSFVNVQALPVLVEGGLLADVIASVASVDSVMGGCDR